MAEGDTRPDRPRQADIARLAGVSQWTVSMVINGKAESGRIPTATRDAVLRIADELGYVPNAAARNLRGSDNRLIGLFTYHPTFPMTRDTAFYEYFLGVERGAEKAGYDLVLFTSAASAGESSQNVYRNGTNRLNLADGTVMIGFDTNREDLRRLSREAYRFVYIGRRRINGGSIAYVSPDYGRAAADAVDAVVARGHRQIAYVAARELGNAADEPHEDRYRGYRAALRSSRLPDRTALDCSQRAVGAEWLRQARTAGVTAVIVEDEHVARKLLGLCRRARLRVPADLSVVVLDSVVGGPRRGVAWSATAIPRVAVGEKSVELLVDMLRHGVSGEVPHELVPCEAPDAATIAAVPDH